MHWIWRKIAAFWDILPDKFVGIFNTEKQRLYFNEVIRLHYEEGMGEDRISRILPIGHTTASRWIAIFAMEKGRISKETVMGKRKVKPEAQPQSEQDKVLKKRFKKLEARLLQAEIKAGAYDEMKKNWRQTVRDLRAKDSGRYNVRGLCVLFGKSKQAYYQYRGPGPGQGRTGGVRPRVHQGHPGQGPRHRRREAVAHVPEGVQLRRPDRPRPLLPDHRREPPQGASAQAQATHHRLHARPADASQPRQGLYPVGAQPALDQ